MAIMQYITTALALLLLSEVLLFFANCQININRRITPLSFTFKSLF